MRNTAIIYDYMDASIDCIMVESAAPCSNLDSASQHAALDTQAIAVSAASEIWMKELLYLEFSIASVP